MAILGGVSFQPGANGDNGQQSGQSRPAGHGVQEAIKILSLRLPRVVGAHALAPMPLLTSQGSGGDRRVDSIVQRVMQMFPTNTAPSVPVLPAGSNERSGTMPTEIAPVRYEPGPDFWGASRNPSGDRHVPAPYPRPRTPPRFVPAEQGDDPIFETPLPAPRQPSSPLPSDFVVPDFSGPFEI